MIVGKFPAIRQRRLRSSPWIRDLVSESAISVKDLILPVFVKDGIDVKEPVTNMSCIFRYSLDNLIKLIDQAVNLQIPSVIVFPCIPTSLRSERADEAYNPDNLICKTIKSIKSKFGDKIGVITDVALDPYTSHGHDGVLENGEVNNDATIDILCKQALVQAAAGADIVSPSDMMDGRIKHIRHALDLGNFYDVIIMSYSAKYHSCFYSPFRDALESSNIYVNKSSYQMDFRNSNEAMMKIGLDIQEGADIVIIKPAMMYGDIIREARQKFQTPIFAYQVSGEYSMLSNFGMRAMIESITCIKRAGAKSIITYGAIEIAKLIKGW